MRLVSTQIAGSFIAEVETIPDERGFFARSWSREEAARHRLNPHVEQCSISFNGTRGTVRGLHYQVAPYAEAKLVRCTLGAIYDVAVDLRAESSTYLAWVAVELTAENRRALYIPEGCAHGYQSLSSESEVLYQISAPYQPEYARGVRWNDPAVGIPWPIRDPLVSERDRALPLIDPPPC